MQLKDLTTEEIKGIFKYIDEYLETKEEKWVKYADFGCKTVKIVSYSDEFLPLVEKQLTYALKDSSEYFDDTLIIWNETDILNLSKELIKKLPRFAMRLRLEMVHRKARSLKLSEEEIYNLQILYDDFSKTKPIVYTEPMRGFFGANDKENHKYYYGVKDLRPEEFIKEGHIFVQFLNNILKTPTSNLVHGAVIGYNGNGICFCARGQRGKSTLSVLSMMKGFGYVSDDYLILHENDKKELLSSPIYSIITLSPEMYNRLYDLMDGCRFVSNNGRKDKYVFNIANFHDRFKKNYPIKLCIFPEIVSDKEPSIRPCTNEEKGRAVVQIIQSTLMQTQDLSENITVKKLMNMVKDYPFYKFNLCHDIDKNTEFLREFMNNFDKQKHEIIGLDKICVDVTFDLANILNSETGIIYSMNYFATNIYENLLKGVSKENILNALKQVKNMPQTIERDLNLFVDALKEKEILVNVQSIVEKATINQAFIVENNYKLSLIEHAEEKYMELVKENKNELCVK
mgnify:CR=1 FL=1